MRFKLRTSRIYEVDSIAFMHKGWFLVKISTYSQRFLLSRVNSHPLIAAYESLLDVRCNYNDFHRLNITIKLFTSLVLL